MWISISFKPESDRKIKIDNTKNLFNCLILKIIFLGIYVNPKSTYAPPEFHGIGIRIEDDVFIEKNNKFTVLTQKCPKEIVDIEKIAKMNQC